MDKGKKENARKFVKYLIALMKRDPADIQSSRDDGNEMNAGICVTDEGLKAVGLVFDKKRPCGYRSIEKSAEK